MAEMSNERRCFRIGFVLCVFVAGFAALMVGTAGLREAIAEPLMLVPLAAMAIGIGLLVGVGLARVLGVVLFAGLAAVTTVQVILMLVRLAEQATWDLDWFLPIANLLASAALQLWLDVRAIQVLLDRPLPQDRATTARVAGGALAVIALWHLAMAFELGLGWRGASATISATATHLLGFIGWPAWHLALLLLACGLMFGRGRLLRHAATGLTLLFLLLGPLLVHGLHAQAPFLDLPPEAMPLDAGMVALAVMMALIPAYLAWWLRDEVSTAA